MKFLFICHSFPIIILALFPSPSPFFPIFHISSSPNPSPSPFFLHPFFLISITSLSFPFSYSFPILSFPQPHIFPIPSSNLILSQYPSTFPSLSPSYPLDLLPQNTCKSYFFSLNWIVFISKYLHYISNYSSLSLLLEKISITLIQIIFLWSVG